VRPESKCGLPGDGSAGSRVASSLLVAHSVARVTSNLDLLGPSAGRLGASFGALARVATAVVAVRLQSPLVVRLVPSFWWQAPFFLIRCALP
jgi:hypothetical protein